MLGRCKHSGRGAQPALGEVDAAVWRAQLANALRLLNQCDRALAEAKKCGVSACERSETPCAGLKPRTRDQGATTVGGSARGGVRCRHCRAAASWGERAEPSANFTRPPQNAEAAPPTRESPVRATRAACAGRSRRAAVWRVTYGGAAGSVAAGTDCVCKASSLAAETAACRPSAASPACG